MSSRSLRMLEMAKSNLSSSYNKPFHQTEDLQNSTIQHSNANAICGDTSNVCEGELHQELDQSHLEQVSLPGTSSSEKHIFEREALNNENEVISESEADPFENASDSDKDPDYVPTDNSCDYNIEGINAVEEMTAQLEQNLMEVDDENVTSSKLPLQKCTRKYRQRKRNLGKSYVTAKGITRMDRACQVLQACRKKCNERISYDNQKIIFEQYWKLGNYNLRLAFVSGLIDIKPKNTQTLRDGNPTLKNRRFSCSYFINISGQKNVVCKTCLTRTLGETQRFINTVIGKKYSSAGTVISLDLRGKTTPSNKIDDHTIGQVRSHINSFPAYESHYTRRDTSKKYLHGDLTISKMYELYTEAYDNPVSLSKYSELFRECNLAFKKPKTDTCNTCETIKMKIDLAENETEKNLLKIDQQNHHADADNAYKAKEKDKIYCKSVNSSKIYTFDLQQCLPTPYLQTSVSFYKRPLWTYNLTIHDCVSNEPFCYMWHEGIGKRGGNEISSCLYKHLQSLPPSVKNLIFYSDSCAGQNKNSFVATMFLCFLQWQDDVEVIDHKFLTVGHSHMECDTDHAIIEKQKKRCNIKIHHPRDWYTFIQSIRSKKQFNVCELTQEDFFNFSQLAKFKFIWRPKGVDGQLFSWHSVRWLRYTKDFGTVLYKTSLDEEAPFKSLNIKKRGITAITHCELKKTYNIPLKISTEKKKDLLSLLPLISPVFHQFYEDLSDETMPDIHPDLLDEESVE